MHLYKNSESSVIYYVKSLGQLCAVLRNVAQVQPVGGGTGLVQYQITPVLTLPSHLVVLNGVPELKDISKTEQFLEFGGAVSLQAIVQLGRKNIPVALHEALSHAANPGIRTLATIGGNIAGTRPHASALAPLIALDAKMEVRTGHENFWISVAHYAHARSDTPRHRSHVITRIRLPTDYWDFSYYRRIGSRALFGERADFVFLAQQQKNALSEMRMVFFSDVVMRNREFDNLLLGRAIPLSAGDIAAIVYRSREFFAPESFKSAYIAHCFFHLLEDCLRRLR